MSDLAEKKCIPCEGGIPSFNLEEIHKYLKKVDGWDVESVNKVGQIAEQEGHHPDIWFGWGYAKIKIQTHAINGLHESDFVLAAKIDRIN